MFGIFSCVLTFHGHWVRISYLNAVTHKLIFEMLELMGSLPPIFPVQVVYHLS